MLKDNLKTLRKNKGLSQEEVQQLEIVHKSELIKNGYDITKKKTYYLSDLIENAKTYFNAHYTRPTERNYVLMSLICASLLFISVSL